MLRNSIKFLFLFPNLLASVVKATPVKNPTDAARKPIIIIIPEAWYTNYHYQFQIEYWQSLGWPCTRVQNPSTFNIGGSSNNVTTGKQQQDFEGSSQTARSDAGYFLHHLISPWINTGAYVILVMHGYGAITGSAAAKGLSVEQRQAKGQSGGILGLIAVSGVLAEGHQSYLDMMPLGNWPFWTLPGPSVVVARDAGYVLFDNAATNIQQQLAARLLPQAVGALTTNAGVPGWTDPGYAGRLLYVVCEKDKAYSTWQQRDWIRRSGVDWEIQDFWDYDHSPFVSHSRDFGDFVIEVAKDWWFPYQGHGPLQGGNGSLTVGGNGSAF